MNTNVALVGAAATGALGYAIACWLAEATEYATEIEQRAFRREPSAPAAGRVASPRST